MTYMKILTHEWQGRHLRTFMQKLCCFHWGALGHWVLGKLFQIANFIWLIYRIIFTKILTFKEGRGNFPRWATKTWQGNTPTASILNLHEVTFFMKVHHEYGADLLYQNSKISFICPGLWKKKLQTNSKSDFDLSTLTATKFCKWLNLFRRILKSIFLSPHWSKSFKSLSLYRHKLFNAK